MEWTDNITKGIKSVFSPFGRRYEIYFEYLDTKRNSGKAYQAHLTDFLLSKKRYINYEIIIVSDNNALAFIKKHSSTLFPKNPPIVFCGINNFTEAMIDGMENITGVTESTDHKATIEISQKLHPERNNILVILDKTPTGDSIYEELKEIEPFYKGRIQFEFYRDFLLTDIPLRLTTLGNNHLIYLLTFNRDKNNNFVSYSDGIEIVSQNTQVPIYGSWDFYLGKGIVGGRITSGYLQGKEAAQMALMILNGRNAKDIKIIKNCPTQFIFDYQHMKDHQIKPSQLPRDSQIINQPPDLYTKHKNAILTVTVILLVFSITLFGKSTRQKTMLKKKRRLQKSLKKG